MKHYIKKFATGITIIAIISIALSIILDIWNFISSQTLWKLVLTIGVIATVSFILVVVIKMTEDKKYL